MDKINQCYEVTTGFAHSLTAKKSKEKSLVCKYFAHDISNPLLLENEQKPGKNWETNAVKSKSVKNWTILKSGKSDERVWTPSSASSSGILSETRKLSKHLLSATFLERREALSNDHLEKKKPMLTSLKKTKINKTISLQVNRINLLRYPSLLLYFSY